MGIMAAFEAVLPLPAAAQFIEANVSAGQRLFGILQEKPAVVDVRQAQELPSVTFEIAFEKVTFTYPKGEQPALSDISFRVPPGAKIAVVGPSGAGKSSLAQLLLRLYEFEQGKILLDGQDIRRFKQESIRERVAFVSQRIHLFTGTIGENLRMVNPELSDEALIDLLRLVELHADDLQTDSPLDYWIGEHGNRLSGGQAQRLAIAQALCKPAMVFVFDEITANLDPQTEQRVLRNLFERYQGKTVINITHRLTGMERYDRILVFREGKLVEEGTHQTLMRQGTVYRHMMAVQQEQNLL
jgi:ATP-binding cassette subfamily C protein CydC